MTLSSGQTGQTLDMAGLPSIQRSILGKSLGPPDIDIRQTFQTLLHNDWMGIEGGIY